MPANEFEKQVQQQLDNFQLNPSASVWKKVEEEIREKKRRRIILFILLPVILALLGFSFYEFLYTGKQPASGQQPVTVTKTEKGETPTATVPGKINESIIPGKEQATASNVGATTKEEKTTEQKPLQNSTQTTTDAITSADKKERTAQQKMFQAKKKVVLRKDVVFAETDAMVGRSVSKPVVKDNNDAGVQKAQDNSQMITSTISPQQDKPVTTDASSMVIDTKAPGIQQTTPAEKQSDIPAINGKDVVALKKDSSNITENVTTPDSKQETITKKKKTSSKIKWGIDFSTGLAANNSGTLSFAKAQAFDANYYNPGSITGAGSSPPANPPSVIIPPSTVKAGLSFKLGMVAAWKLSTRSSLSTGLQYAYSSNRIKIGMALDTSVLFRSNANAADLSVTNVDKLYRGAQKNNYTNGYHFIQLPIDYHLQINKSKKLPLQWDAGVSVGYLLSTHALVYDGVLGGIYYEDKKAYNKVHFNLSTGLSFRVSTKNSGEWVIGPALSFDMTRLVKNDNKQYLMFGGINAKLFFPKKKTK